MSNTSPPIGVKDLLQSSASENKQTNKKQSLKTEGTHFYQTQFGINVLWTITVQ
jgi:hypothetical protein